MENPFKKTKEHVQDKLETNDYLNMAIEEAGDISIPEESRDKEGNLLSAPNGPKSKLENELYWKMVRTNSFKQWFGDWENDKENSSKVVDENGEPLLTYHASFHEIEKLSHDSSNHLLTLGKGIYLTPDASLSSIYGDKFYSCFVNTRKAIKESSNLPQGAQIAKTLFYSLTRPKDTVLSSKFEDSEIMKKELYGEDIQFSVLHQENVMIVPSGVENPKEQALNKEISYIKNNFDSSGID